MTSVDDQGPPLGAVLAGRYELRRRVGEDGEAYEAWDARLRREVTVRVHAMPQPEDPTLVEGELRALADVTDPGWTRVVDAGTDGDAAFVVLQPLGEPTALAELPTDPDMTQPIAVGDTTTIQPLPFVPVDLPEPTAAPRPGARRNGGLSLWLAIGTLAAALVLAVGAAAWSGGSSGDRPTADTTEPTVAEAQVSQASRAGATVATTPTTLAPTTTAAPKPEKAKATELTVPPVPGFRDHPGPGKKGDR